MKIIKKKSVLILEDHPIYLAGLNAVINETPFFSVSGAYRTSGGLLSSPDADVAILDLSRPEEDISINEIVEKMKNKYPLMRLVALGESREHECLSALLKKEIDAYICKSAPPQEIVGLLEGLFYKKKTITCSGPDAGPCSQLTAGEEQVIKYFRSGMTVSKIAEHIQRSVKTVSNQKRSAMKKLGVTRDRDLYLMDL